MRPRLFANWKAPLNRSRDRSGAVQLLLVPALLSDADAFEDEFVTVNLVLRSAQRQPVRDDTMASRNGPIVR